MGGNKAGMDARDDMDELDDMGEMDLDGQDGNLDVQYLQCAQCAFLSMKAFLPRCSYEFG